MYAQVDKAKENKSKAVANPIAQKKNDLKQGFGFVDNRPESIAQRKMQNLTTRYSKGSQKILHSMQLKSNTTTPKILQREVIQCLSYEKGYGSGSWEGWTGPWRDEEAKDRWNKIESAFGSVKAKIAQLQAEATGSEKSQLDRMSEQIANLDKKVISYQEGENVLISLNFDLGELNRIQKVIDERRALSRAQEADEETSDCSYNLHHVAALALMAAIVTWRTFQSRYEAQTRGRAGHAADQFIHQINTMTEQLEGQVETAENVLQTYRQPFRQGFLMGVDPLPMPIADEYASWDEVWRTFNMLVFLTTAGEDEWEEHLTRMRDITMTPMMGRQHDGEQGDQRISTQDSMRVRNDLRFGFGAGVTVGSGIQSQLPIVSSPVTMIQVPWDTYHVVNTVAISTRNARIAAEGNRRRLMALNERMMIIRGQQKMRRLPRQLALPLLITGGTAFMYHKLKGTSKK